MQPWRPSGILVVSVAVVGLFLTVAVIGGFVKEAHHAPARADSAPAPAAIATAVSAAARLVNRLGDQPSLYLRQHADNPIAWQPWDDVALARAVKEDKPIFLSIGYASCHWCHVMEHEVFEKLDVAAFMNQHFICIKVDREERPDLDAVYMDAVQALSGRGGWPMSVFLTPQLKPFYGGTYFPHDAFMEVVANIARLFRERRSELEKDAKRLSTLIAAKPEATPGGALDAKVLDGTVEKALQMVDREWGGLGDRQKFPTPLRWRFLLHHYRRTGGERTAAAVRQVLDNMGSGGIHDHVAGGFHRYTVEPTWVVPHFEKMLYDNAQLASLYIEASTVFESERYGEIGRDLLDFLIRDMSGDEGGFYASFDADSDGEEGSFYVWSPSEIVAVAGAQDGPLLAALLGVTESGNFEGKNVLTRRTSPAAVASSLGRSPGDGEGLFDRWRDALRQQRAQRVAPSLDRKVVTSWNGLAIEALALGYTRFGDGRYLRAAERAVEFLWRVHRSADGTLFHSSTLGRVSGHGILDDYAFFANGLLALYEASGDLAHLRRALELVEIGRERFSQPDAAFFLTPTGAEAPLGRKQELFDAVEPSGNAAMLHALLGAGALTGNQAYLAQAESILLHYAELTGRAGLEMAWWLDAALKRLGPFYDVVIAGEAGQAEVAELLKVYRDILPTHAVLVQIPGQGASAAATELMPPLRGKRALGGKATAYVCEKGSCQLPTADPATFKKQLLAGWLR